MLCEKYKLEEFNLQRELLMKLREEKNKRKRRRLLDRGFKGIPPVEEEPVDEAPIESDGEEKFMNEEEKDLDAEIEDDQEDFDKALHEREVLKSILDSKKGLVIDATWVNMPAETVSQPL
jgi:hypothetical protein